MQASSAAALPFPVSRRRAGGLGREQAAVFSLALLIYLATGSLLAIVDHLIAGDAMARVADAHRILFSRDPHLAAIGFVWSPLPVIAMLPVVALNAIWPALTDLGFASNLTSALCMAGATLQLYGLLRDLGVRRLFRIALTTAFAAHPLVLFYGANGMSEAMLLFFLLWGTRQLTRWLETRDVAAGVCTGIALAGAYLARYEALPAGLAAVCLVAAVSWASTGRADRRRLHMALSDAAIVGLPIALALGFWLGASWIVTGHPFEQLASAYGNGAQQQAALAAGAAPAGWLRFAFEQALNLEPFLPAVLLLAALGAGRHRSSAILAPLLLLGSVLSFMLWANASGFIDHELRYSIVAVPLAVLLAGVAVSAASARQTESRSSLLRPATRTVGPLPIGLGRGWSSAMVSVGAIVMVGTAVPVAASAMLSPRINPVDALVIRSVFNPEGQDEKRAAHRFVTDRQIAQDLDQRHLPAGSVLVDDFLGFAVVVSSRNPTQFVITSDRDFDAILGDPAALGVRYLLVPQPGGLGDLDAINRQYPGMYASGAGVAALVREYANVGDRAPLHWRLYQIQ